MSTLNDIDHMPGAEVVCPDGVVGQLEMIGVKPKSDEITHLIIRRGFFFTRDLLVPVDLVDDISEETNQIHLKAPLADVVSMPEFHNRRMPDMTQMAWTVITWPLQQLVQYWTQQRLENQRKMIDVIRQQRSQETVDLSSIDPTIFKASHKHDVHMINLNTASHEELEEIKGIGPSIAHRIIEHRPIHSLDALINAIPELTSQTAERLRKVSTL